VSFADKFRRIFQKQEPPRPSLQGAPKVRREKTHSADTGYVYQYFYEGYRESEREGEPGWEYVFSVTADRKTRFPLTVFLGDRSVDAWNRDHDRELNETERYAVVKMVLFATFDERSSLGSEPADVIISPADIEQHAQTLDL